MSAIDPPVGDDPPIEYGVFCFALTLAILWGLSASGQDSPTSPPVAMTDRSGNAVDPADRRPIRVGDVLAFGQPRLTPHATTAPCYGASWQVAMPGIDAFDVVERPPTLADAYGHFRGARLSLMARRPGRYRVEFTPVYFEQGQWRRGSTRSFAFEVLPR